jgi:hypothetical protein
MDPLTAIATMITALANVYLEILKSTPDANKAKVSDWIVQDMTQVRAFFKIGPHA